MLWELFLRFVRSRQFGFLFVGGCIFLLQFFTLKYVVETYGADEKVSNLIIQTTAMEVSFLVNKFFNWKDRVGSFINHWWKFHHIRGGTYLFNQACFFVLVPLGVQYLYLNVALAALELAVHYFFNDTYAFKKGS